MTETTLDDLAAAMNRERAALQAQIDAAFESRDWYRSQAERLDESLRAAWEHLEDTTAIADRALRRQKELSLELLHLRAAIQGATDPDNIRAVLDDVHDMDVTFDDYARAVSQAIRAAVEAVK